MIFKVTKKAHRRLLSIVVPLVLVNAGLLHVLARQIATVQAQSVQVLDATVSAPPVDVSATDPSLATDERSAVITYTVVSGDTLSQIAERFNISTNTIRWANNLTGTSKIRVGDKLRILPVSGIEYTVVKGDTISQIAERFHGKQSEILDFNDLDSADKIKPGLELIIPEGSPIAPPKPVKQTKPITTPTTSTKTQAAVTPTTPSVQPAPAAQTTDDSEHSSKEKYVAPLPGSVLSQGLHDGTAVDFAAPSGTEVIAARSGTVTSVRDSNIWNGGYGYYLIITHDDGVQTLYAHLSRIDVEVGDSVEQGEHIALSGRTGRVTGPHLHFEVRGESNPFVHDSRGTRY